MLKASKAQVAKRFMRKYKATAVARMKNLTTNRLYGVQQVSRKHGYFTARGRQAEAVSRLVSSTGKLKKAKAPKKAKKLNRSWSAYQSRLHARRAGWED